MGEVLLTGVVVIAFSMVATLVFSLDAPVDCPHVAVEKWGRAPTDTLYIRHCGGDILDTEDLKIMVSIDESSYVYSGADVSGNLNKSVWDLGDVIAINTKNEWGVPLSKGDSVFVYLVDMDSKQVVRKVKVPVNGGGSGGWVSPSEMLDSAGSSNLTAVLKEGDGNVTHYLVPKKGTSGVNGTGEVFFFDIDMADYDFRLDEPVSNVTLKLVYETHDDSFFYIQLRVFDAYPPPGEWYNESFMPESSSSRTYVTNLSDCINTTEDLEGLKIKIVAVGNAASNKEVNVDYIAVSFE
ncbi:type IV pilin [Methanosarcina sp. KYL-1]|nr:type IV pilin [Methanosarcina sp. KYL-1]